MDSSSLLFLLLLLFSRSCSSISCSSSFLRLLLLLLSLLSPLFLYSSTCPAPHCAQPASLLRFYAPLPFSATSFFFYLFFSFLPPVSDSSLLSPRPAAPCRRRFSWRCHLYRNVGEDFCPHRSFHARPLLKISTTWQDSTKRLVSVSWLPTIDNTEFLCHGKADAEQRRKKMCVCRRRTPP